MLTAIFILSILSNIYFGATMVCFIRIVAIAKNLKATMGIFGGKK